MKRVITIILALALMFSLTACSSSSPATAPDPSSGGLAYAEPEFVWRFQMVHSPGQPEFDIHSESAETIYKLSNGRMRIDVYPNGALASSLEMLSAAGEGAFEMSSCWPMYLKGIEYAILPAGDSEAMSMNWEEKLIWMHEAGGKEQMQKALDKSNLHMVSFQMQPADVLLANKMFTSMDDMAGTKMRTTSVEVPQAFGIAPISLSMEDVFTALAGGTVETAEFGTLWWNAGFGLNDLAQYGIFPDWWNVTNMETTVVNKDAWNSLPEELQLLVETVFMSNAIRTTTTLEYKSAELMRDLHESGKMKFVRFSDEDMVKAREYYYKTEQEYAKTKGELTAETYQMLYDFYELYYPYKSLTAWWGDNLTPSQAAGFEIKDYNELNK